MLSFDYEKVYSVHDYWDQPRSAWSLISRSFGFKYQSLLIVSVLTYAAVGFVAVKRGDLMLAAFAGSIVGFTDATLGWYISWVIGPGRPAVEMDLVSIFLTVILVAALGALFGFLGGLAGRLV